ncbi:MAG TPA: DUF4476 domain-containing protein [Chitinophagaceae bacterium]|nr:DUF4476 domain-containing protein [Chitinophagaceae bacterium]
MKTIFTLFASLFMSIAVFAGVAKGNSILTVTSLDNSNIRVIVDGQQYEPNDNSIVLSNLAKGSHAVKVYRIRNNGFVAGKRYEMVYNSTLSMKGKTNTQLTVEKNGRITMQQTKVNNGRGGVVMSDDRGQYGDYDSHDAYAAGMNDREFRTTLQAINKEWLESNKLKSALQIVHSNSLTSDQVKQMALLFTFENNKLELAKQAYANTVDKRNYSTVFDVFSFESNKSELDRYIRNIR